jgi:hypothetical protein
MLKGIPVNTKKWGIENELIILVWMAILRDDSSQVRLV